MPLRHNFRRFYERKVFQVLTATILVSAAVLGIWFGLQLALDASPPVTFISTDHMSVGPLGIGSIFSRTLQPGDAVLIAGINPANINANYPNSDILVFHRPDNFSQLAVYRIVAKAEIGGKWYFSVKGDGESPSKWPTEVNATYYQNWQNQNESLPSHAVSEDLLVGRVFLRIPLAGSLAAFMHDLLGLNNFVAFVLPAIVVLTLLVIAIGHIESAKTKKHQPIEQKVPQLRMQMCL